MTRIEFLRYVLEDPSGHQHGTLYDSVDKAREAARMEPAVAIIALQYEYSDSDLVEVWRHGVKTDEEAWPGDPIHTFSIVSNQGTAMSEATLCSTHHAERRFRDYALRVAQDADDFGGDKTWHDSTGNDAVRCVECLIEGAQ